MFEAGLGEKLNEMFRWIEDVPVAISLSDAETLEVLKCNTLFSDMFKLSTLGGIKVTLDGIDADDGAKSVVTLSIGGIVTHLFTSVKLFSIDGKSILLSTHENLMHLIKTDDKTGMSSIMEKSELDENTRIVLIDKNSENALGGAFNRKGGLDALQKQINLAKEGARFTLCYFRIEAFGEGFDKAEALESAIAAVKGGTRQTDILAKMDSHDYILIFPKCAYEVVESIMGTIEKKIEVFNETADAGYGIAIEYTIAEYDPTKKQSPESFVNDLKRDID
jgi:GGDEF domain-containing protein